MSSQDPEIHHPIGESPDDDTSELIIDGENARMEILMCIHEARQNIRIRMFMWRDDRSGNMILRALEKKASSFPHIRIHIEKDVFGSLVYNMQNILSFGRMGGDIFSTTAGRAFLKNNKNIRISYIGSWIPLSIKYLSDNDHSKVFLFDELTSQSQAIIGGMNLGDQYLSAEGDSASPEGGWHDYMVKIKGSLVNGIAPKKGVLGKRGIKRSIRAGIEVFTTLRQRLAMRKQIIRVLSQAKKSIIVEHGYLTDRSVIRVLRQLNRAGIKIQVILPDTSDGAWHANMHSAEKLLRRSLRYPSYHSTIEVFLYPGMIHAKALLIDQSIAIIGSANLTYGSFDHLHETNVIFRGKSKVVQTLAHQLQEDIEKSTRLTLRTVPEYYRILALIQRNII